MSPTSTRSAGIHQPDDCKIDENVGHRVHERRDPPHILLCPGQILIAGVKAADLLLLLAEGTDHPDAGEVFPGCTEHAVQFSLHPFVQGDAPEHDAEYHQGQHRNGGCKDQRCLYINGERHNHGAKYHKRRAQQQPEGQIHTGLNLVHITGHAGNEGGGAYGVQLCVGQPLYVVKEGMPQFRHKTDGALAAKYWAVMEKNQSHNAKPHQQQAHAYHISPVAAGNACVDDGSNHQGHQQLQQCLKQLEQRSQYRLFFL